MEQLEVTKCDLKLGRIKVRPRVFTEQGVAMLSSILNSKVAIEVNIHIIRVFAKDRIYTGQRGGRK